MVHLLSQLQLPRMSLEEPPTLRILAVADIDLASAAALAEYSLNEKELGAGNVDLCIACGPFVRDEDVRKRYLQGRSKWRQQHRAPQDRTREETAALEGLMTAALSQLESIVCRLVFCPHPTDPSTTIFTTEHLRLTPNSVNVHQRWLQLAPGIGCSGYAGITDEQGRTTGPDRVHVQHGYVVFLCVLFRIVATFDFFSRQTFTMRLVCVFSSPADPPMPTRYCNCWS